MLKNIVLRKKNLFCQFLLQVPYKGACYKMCTCINFYAGFNLNFFQKKDHTDTKENKEIEVTL